MSIIVPQFQDSYSCSGNESENQCFDNPSHTRIESIYEALKQKTFTGVDGFPHTANQFVAKTESLNYDNAYGDAHGDLRTLTYHHLMYTPETVRLVIAGVDSFAVEESCDEESGECTLQEKNFRTKSNDLE